MPADRRITGTLLRDVVVCERRAAHDAHADPALRDEVGSFVRMLWEEGVRHETEVLGGMDGRIADLRGLSPADRRRGTMTALLDPTIDHVLGAEIAHDDLLGRPDVISRIDGRWTAGDVKSGTPYMADGIRVKAEYGVQIGLYARILGESGMGDGGRAFVIGPDGTRATFDLDAPWSRSTMADKVEHLIVHARDILWGDADTRGAASAQCGLCHWRTLCRRELEAADDLTLIAEVGRTLRGVIERVAPDRAALADLDVEALEPRALPGLGLPRLERLRDRARLQKTEGGRAYARVPLGLSRAALEWHLDIESDPTRGGYVYLHGVWERRLDGDGGSSERFIHFFADGPDGERDAFAAAWSLLGSEPEAMIYYYSPFERTSYRALQRRHPEVCSADDVERFFAGERVVDLYTAVVRPHTEWPLESYGLKPIAKSRGFAWAAEDASGASSIAWYDEYRRTGDERIRDRIIDYNRSDVIASAVVLDALLALPVGVPPWPPGPVDERRDPVDGPVRHVSASSPPAVDGSADAAATTPAVVLGEDERGEPADVAPAIRVSDADGSTWMRDDHLSSYAILTLPLPLLGACAVEPAPVGFGLTEHLRRLMPWLEPAIVALERSLLGCAWNGRPWLAFPPLLLIGPSGVGRCSLAREIAAFSGVPIAVAERRARDGTHLAGTSREWAGAGPSWPVREIAARRVGNPLLVVPDLDAMLHRDDGSLCDALASAIDRSSSIACSDPFVPGPLDLSAVLWILTAGDRREVPARLLSRLEVVEVRGPGPEHFEIVRGAIEREVASAWGVPASALPILPRRADAVLRTLFERRRSIADLRSGLLRLLEAALPLPRPVLH